MIVSNIILRRLLVSSAALFGLAGAFAQPWSLQQCIDHAVSNNIRIKQSELNSRLAGLSLLQSKADLLPSLNGSASHAYSFGRTVDLFTNEFVTDRVQSNSFSVNSSVLLFNGFQAINTIKKNRLDDEAGRYDTEKMRNDITLAVISSYLQVLFSEESLETAGLQAGLSAQQLAKTSTLVEAGVLAKGNRLDMEAQAALDEMQLVNARNQLDLAYLTLVQLLDLDSVRDFRIVRPAFDVPAAGLLGSESEIIFGKALKTQPEIKGAEARVQSADKSLAIARGAQSPSLVLRGSYGSGYSDARQSLTGYTLTGVDTIGYTATGSDNVLAPSYDLNYETTSFKDQLDQNVNKAIGFYLTIPVFNGLQTRTAISRAKIAALNAQYNYELAKDELRKSVQQALADAKAALENYQATKKSVGALEEAFRYTELKAAQGLVDAVIYMEAKNRLAKAQSDLLRGKYDYFFKLKTLEYYEGRPLSF